MGKHRSVMEKAWTKERRKSHSEKMKASNVKAQWTPERRKQQAAVMLESLEKAKLNPKRKKRKKRVHKIGRTEEYRAEKSRMMKALHKKCKEEGRKLCSPPSRKSKNKPSKTSSESKRRMHRNRCPFTMVDGVKLEMESMDRYNTHSGVITETEAENVCEL